MAPRAYNNKRKTNRTPKPSNNVRKSKAGTPKNNVRKGAPSSPAKDLADIKKEINKLRNKSVKANRRDYIARTFNKGIDEFNDTTIRPVKGGRSASTKDLAKFNKAKLIKASAKPTLKGGLAGVAMTAIDLAARKGALGKKVQQSTNEWDSRTDKAVQMAMDALKRLRGKKQK